MSTKTPLPYELLEGAVGPGIFANLPARVEIGECWARDGLQSLDTVVPTDKKIEMIDRFSDAGFSHIEVTSFANPKYLPQFADAREVLAGIKRKPGVGYRVVVPNLRGMERLVAMLDEGIKVDEALFVCSASEAHNLENTNRTVAEQKKEVAQMMDMAKKAGLKIVGSVLTSFGCPITGDVPIEVVRDLGRWYVDHGADFVQWGDTTGMANPRQAYAFYRYMFAALPWVPFIVHFHDTRGTGMANNLAALLAGATIFDGSVGGIGGQPAGYRPKYHQGYTGNTVTEDLVCMLEEMGVHTGIGQDEVVAIGRQAEKILGQTLRAQVTQCGPVLHQPRS